MAFSYLLTWSTTAELLGQPATGFRPQTARQTFLAKFRAPTQGTTEYQSGIPQALTLMNGVSIRRATDLRNSDLLITVTTAPFIRTDAKRVETLFLGTLSRRPNDDESALFVSHVSDSSNQRQALGDVLWALLNSAEFALNH